MSDQMIDLQEKFQIALNCQTAVNLEKATVVADESIEEFVYFSSQSDHKISSTLIKSYFQSISDLMDELRMNNEVKVTFLLDDNINNIKLLERTRQRTLAVISYLRHIFTFSGIFEVSLVLSTANIKLSYRVDLDLAASSSITNIFYKEIYLICNSCPLLESFQVREGRNNTFMLQGTIAWDHQFWKKLLSGHKSRTRLAETVCQ